MNSFLRPAVFKSNGRAAQAALPAREDQTLRAGFFWLSVFYVVYCARPEEWIPGWSYLPLPLAKLSGIFAVLSLVFSLGKVQRSLRNLPREATYLLILIALLLPAALFSPVWRGGAFFGALDFGKVYIAWILTFLLVTNFAKFRRILFIQAGSVAVISIVSVLKSRGGAHPRLTGVLGGIYGNPNDLAFAMVLSLPICLAFMLSARGVTRKALWTGAMMVMLTAVFMTGSRGGLITLVVAGMVGLWHFAVRGRRLHLIAVAIVVGILLFGFASTTVRSRFSAIVTGSEEDETSAYASYEARRQLMTQAIDGIAHHPLFGIGAGNFVVASGTWHEVHMAYLQIGVEGGIPALVIYLLFFWHGFVNLRKLRKMRNLDPETTLFAGALHSSLIGFMTGACFAPVAYNFFPYFTVAYTSVLLALQTRRPEEAAPASPAPLKRFEAKQIFAHLGKPNEPAPVR